MGFFLLSKGSARPHAQFNDESRPNGSCVLSRRGVAATVASCAEPSERLSKAAETHLILYFSARFSLTSVLAVSLTASRWTALREAALIKKGHW